MLFDKITIKGQNSSNTRKWYYLEENVREINSRKRKNGFKRLQQSHELTNIIQSALAEVQKSKK
jgi:hypothetical protein